VLAVRELKLGLGLDSGKMRKLCRCVGLRRPVEPVNETSPSASRRVGLLGGDGEWDLSCGLKEGLAADSEGVRERANIFSVGRPRLAGACTG